MKSLKVLLCLSLVLLSNLLHSRPTTLDLPSFLLEQIDEDLNELTPPFLTNGLSSKEINDSWEELKTSNLAMRVQYNGKTIKFSPSDHIDKSQHMRYSVMRNAIQKCLSKEEWKGKHLDAIVYMEDGMTAQPTIPMFGFTKIAHTKNAILIPDFEALDSRQRNFLVSHILHTPSPDWKTKEKKLFWRGSTTGGSLTGDLSSDLQMPRAKLVLFNHPLIDAKFTTIVQVAAENREKVAQLFQLAERIAPRKHLDYRYMLDVDGNSCCYTRTYWTLLSNCLLIKQKSDHIQWYYKGLVEQKNIVYTENNLSNLPDILESLEKQDDEALNQIVQNQSEFAQNYLSYECNIEYLNKALLEYSDRFKTDVKITEEGTPFTDLFWDFRWWCVRTYQFWFEKF